MNLLLQWLDNRTLLLAQVMVASLMVPALLVLRRMNPRMRGSGTLAASFLVGIPGILLISLRGSISQFLSIIVGNGLVVLCYYLIYRGIQHFLQDRSRYLWLAEISAVGTMLVLLYYTYVTPNISIRTIAAAWLICITRLLPAITMWRHASGRPLLRFGAIFFALGSLLSLQRVVLTLVYGAAPDYMQRNGVQTTSLLIGFVFAAVTGMFLLALITGEIRADVQRNAETDPLTGALTRAAAERSLDRELEIARQTGNPLSLLLIDIDRFKQFNDTAGHAAGDDALRSVANAIRQQLRSYDTFGRFGGDEMMLLLPATTGEDSLTVAERIRTSIAQLPPIRDGLQLTVSIGVAQSLESDAAETLLARADSALYLVKRDGRNAARLQPPGTSQLPAAASNSFSETLSLPGQ